MVRSCRKTIGSIALLLISFSTFCQVDRYVVYLTDKNNTPYSLESPEDFLSQKSVQRRLDQGIEMVVQDLPVDPAYIEEVSTTGAEVFLSSKWLNALIVASEPSIVSSIEALPFVEKVQKIALGDKPVFNSRKASSYTTGRTQSVINEAQILHLGLNNLHNEGYTGTGIIIAFFDSGYRGVNTIEAFQHVINNNRLIHAENIPECNTDVYVGDDHGTEVFSVVGGFSDDSFTGTAYSADFALFITEDLGSEYPIEEYNWLIAAEKADSLGVDIINSSLGYNTFDLPFDSYEYADMDGNTTVVSRAADIASSKGMLVVTSAGNDGNREWRFIVSPADADSVISVGSVGFGGVISAFSAFGPSADGQIKPEVVALGQGTYRINNSGAIVQAPSGTSLSVPMITGLAACIWQSRPEFTNMQLRDTILSIGDRSESPDNRYGYGLPRYGDITTSLASETLKGSCKVYLNPHRGNSFRITGVSIDQVTEVNIFDLTGAQQDNYQWRKIGTRQGEIELVTQSMPAGTYIVQLKSTIYSKQIKILKY
ncbi:S8 family serine peptidase [Fulvivirga sp. M361]|uniref:S8 family peptidase n=1 Tax=Fulvivirga sp. M361 TaxID=2594266 RepID=UPI00117B0DC9|nr:S8 family peptidase [Fulvivirga sp. M361]TRX51391.1 S8 family serine peptidase [Fulvivirga sp. M361]